MSHQLPKDVSKEQVEILAKALENYFKKQTHKENK